MIADNIGFGARFKLPEADGTGVFIKPDGTMRIVPEKVGLHEMVNHRPTILLAAPRSLK
jgi:hypothetical protein